MTDQPHSSLSLPSLEGALPSVPGELFRLHRLCLYIYGLLTRDIPAQAEALTAAAGPSLKKKYRKELAKTLEDELPVLVALHSLEHLAAIEHFRDKGLDELLRGLLLPCFSLSYQHLYEAPEDPLKHILARVDWYLDGEKQDPVSALADFLGTALGDELGDPAPLLEHLQTVFLAEMDRRLELAFRYEFS